MGSYLSLESIDYYQHCNQENKELISKNNQDIKICDCGDYSPHIKEGSCRHCYGHLIISEYNRMKDIN